MKKQNKTTQNPKQALPKKNPHTKETKTTPTKQIKAVELVLSNNICVYNTKAMKNIGFAIQLLGLYGKK